jgi:methionyl-tRNA formyltransferase
LKIIFIGTPEESAKCLKEINKIFEVVFVYTKEDKIRGRGKLKTFTPVKTAAINLNIKFSTSAPNSDYLKSLDADLIVLCSYGTKLDMDVINSAKFGALNIHPSLLPKYRGASPIIATILDGCEETGVSIMKMDEGFDTGPILAQAKVKIFSEDNGETLTYKLFNKGTKLLINTIRKINTGKYSETLQNHNHATSTKLIRKSDGKINWNEEAEKIERQIRAYNPWPMAFSFWNNKNLKILKAKTSGHIFEKPGYVKRTSDNQIIVATKKGSIELNLIQLEGKALTNIQDFINGQPQFVGSVLSY